MFRAAAIFLVIIFATPVRAQTPTEDVRAMMHTLDQTIEIGGFEKVKLKQALEYLNKKMAGKLPMTVDRDAFLAALGADAPDPEEEEISLPSMPRKMKLSLALHLILTQVAKGQATYIVYPEQIEITSLRAASAERLLRNRPIVATFEKRPLKEILDHLACESGLDIHLDAQLEKKADQKVTVRFRNVTLADALVVVTETTGLKFISLERAIIVTTPKRAKVLQREEKERANWLRPALRPF